MSKIIDLQGSRFGWRGALVLPAEYFDQPAAGRLKVWTGTAWALKPIKVWTGSAWQEKPLKAYTATGWK